MNDRVGQQLGNYLLLRLLGQGGQASVYLGEHVYLKSQAALKVRHMVLTAEERAVFLQEAQTLVRLTHPHIVRVLDFALEDGMPFLVMEYAPHGTLRQRHPEGTQLSFDVILPYVQQVASALQYTHDQRLIHRDVKPENMLLNSHDEVLLSDFGLVMHTPHSLSSGATEPMEPSLAGTTPYLAPEQLRGKTQPASDQYALGVVVYEWLCGKPPFRGPFLEVAVQHVSVPPPSLREQVPDLSPAIEEVVLRALAKEPELRFPRVRDFAKALEHASQEVLSPRFTPVLALEHRAEAEQRKSSMQDLPRGTVTLLFTDMEGSTQLLQQLGDQYADVLSECRQLLRTAFQQWSGHEVDTQGDAFFVAFARAIDAVSAVVDGQRALVSHPWPEGTTVRVRMGLHTGEPSLTPEGYVGLDVHRAARIMSAGHGGQVLLSQPTSTLVEQDLPDEVSLRDLGEYRLKDLGRPQRLFQLVISDLPADFPPLKTLDISPNNLPIQPTPFIGREQELTVVGELLLREDVRLLTLTGPGGTGKTRLGLQVVAELSDMFPDGAFFVNLAPISDPALVMSIIAETLGIREVAGHLPLGHLKEFLHQKQMLLLLDNFEQVVSAASQVADLLATCPKLKILVTSREVLHVRAEHEFPVPPLELPDPKHLPNLATLSHYPAIALFLQRARAVKPDFQVTHANARPIAEICARLDGLPLAIELAAARMKLLSPQALLARLSQRLQVLTSTTRDVPARQQTLRNTIAWSYDLLNLDEQRLFRRLSVFVGGCTLDALEAIYAALGEGDETASVFDGVASLIDKSLLQQNEGDNELRFIMLETIREYGLECLTASGEVEFTRRAQADYYLALAEQLEREFYDPQQTRKLAYMEQEHGNLRVVMDWLLERPEARESIEMALRLGVALWILWLFGGSHWRNEGWNFLERALAGSEGVAVRVRAKAFACAGDLAGWLGHFERGEALCQESLALYREIEDTVGMGQAVCHRGMVAYFRGDFAAARSLFEEGMGLAREASDKRTYVWALSHLSFIDVTQGEFDRGRSRTEESLALYRELGDKVAIALMSTALANVLFFQGDLAKAHVVAEESLALYREEGFKDREAEVLAILGEITLYLGDPTTARSLVEESLVIYKETGDQKSISGLLLLLAEMETHQENYTTARALYEESLALARKVDDKLNIAFYLKGLASVVAAQGELPWAARLWGAAEALRETMGTPIPPVYRIDYESSVTAARTQLGEKAFGAAWAEGRSMTPEQALAVKGSLTIPAPVPTTQLSPPLEHA